MVGSWPLFNTIHCRSGQQWDGGSSFQRHKEKQGADFASFYLQRWLGGGSGGAGKAEGCVGRLRWGVKNEGRSLSMVALPDQWDQFVTSKAASVRRY